MNFIRKKEWFSLSPRFSPSRQKRTVSLPLPPIKYKSSTVNIYHCSITRAGSQWIKSIMSDPRIYSYSGLKAFDYFALQGGFDPRKFTERDIKSVLPSRAIITPLYIGFENYLSIKKPDRYKAFYVMRDPRDLIVSTYFSSKNSHQLAGNMYKTRKTLNSMSFTEGMIFIIRQKQERGHFDALRSWRHAPEEDSNVLLLRYEDLTGPGSHNTFKLLLQHCDIKLPEDTLEALLNDYSFRKLSGGRKPGEEDTHSHYRKGTTGDWKEYFNEEITAAFKRYAGDLVSYLGYADDNAW